MNDATTTAGSSYRVLARKYRPSTFAELIGQDAMVRTISNAFESGRIPQAWVLTGVRGVGKTTTARILARALNYELPDGSVTGPTISMPVLGVHCQAIMESRHLDVIEMDAASHNGVEDVRAINEAIRYAPVSARYKVYILDEVHMLSGAAFNALVKTLEEKGIGRPSTYATILSTIQDREYVQKDQGKFRPTELGTVVTTMLVRHFEEIFDVEYTAKMEEELDEVEDGKITWVQALRDFYKKFEKDLKKATKNMENLKAQELPTNEICEKCGGPMVQKWGQFGSFLACAAYPERPIESRRSSRA